MDQFIAGNAGYNYLLVKLNNNVVQGNLVLLNIRTMYNNFLTYNIE
jgi:hypothetical protein